MEDMVRILAAFFSTAFFAALLGFGLAAASRRLRVEKDKKVEALTSGLPGLNCGACGYAGCEAYAQALGSGDDKDASKCSPGGLETKNYLAEHLNLIVQDSGPRMVARLACAGGHDVAGREFHYVGYNDCEAVKIHFDGDKGCKYGCLGMGSCLKSCPVNAIAYTKNGLVKVDRDKCIGCGICVAVCPTGVMKMVPADSEWFVACNSRDKAKTTKSLCSVGCIGCRICERRFPGSGFIVEDNLSILGYNEGEGVDIESAAEACPSKCIIKYKD